MFDIKNLKKFCKRFESGKTVVQLPCSGEWYTIERIGGDRTLIRVAGKERAFRRDQIARFSNVKLATV